MATAFFKCPVCGEPREACTKENHFTFKCPCGARLNVAIEAEAVAAIASGAMSAMSAVNATAEELGAME